MKNNVLYYFLMVSCLSVGLVCCNSPREKSQGAFVVNAYEIVEGQSVVNLSEIASNISYIPLETTDRSMLSRISSIHYLSGKLYVRDAADIIFIFDNKGKFLNSIDRKGRGPGEYTQIASFVPSSAGVLYVLDPYGHVFLYDQSGKFLSSKKIVSKEESLYFNEIVCIGDNILITAYTNREPAKNAYFLCNDTLEVMEKGVLERPNAIKTAQVDGKSFSVLSLDPLFVTTSGDNARIFDHGRDTMYSVNQKGGFEPLFQIDYGKYAVKDRSSFMDTREQNGISMTTPFFETADHFLLSFIAGKHAPGYNDTNTVVIDGVKYRNHDPVVSVLVEKRTGRLRALSNPAMRERGFKDDLEGGPAFWPSFAGSAGELISYKNAYEILESADNQGEQSGLFQGLASSLEEGDNPVVIIVY